MLCQANVRFSKASQPAPGSRAGRSARILAAALALAASACVPRAMVVAPYAAQDDSLDVPLVWRPTDDLRELEGRPAPRGPWQPLRIDPFFDRRPNPQVIGANVQNGAPISVVSAGQVGPFAAAGVRYVLAANGMRADAPDATRVLRGEVTQFFVREDNTYNADVVLHVQVQALDGRVLWDAMVAGRSRRWGRSLSAENYGEAFGNALVEAGKNLFVDPGFQAAVGMGDPRPLPDAGVPPPPPPPTPR